jgi:hypothetical protein
MAVAAVPLNPLAGFLPHPVGYVGPYVPAPPFNADNFGEVKTLQDLANLQIHITNHQHSHVSNEFDVHRTLLAEANANIQSLEARALADASESSDKLSAISNRLKILEDSRANGRDPASRRPRQSGLLAYPIQHKGIRKDFNADLFKKRRFKPKGKKTKNNPDPSAEVTCEEFVDSDFDQPCLAVRVTTDDNGVVTMHHVQCLYCAQRGCTQVFPVHGQATANGGGWYYPCSKHLVYCRRAQEARKMLGSDWVEPDPDEDNVWEDQLAQGLR